MLMGFGLFNLVEGLIDHEILGLHHVNETVSREQWVYWDMGFLLWGAVMMTCGYLIWRRGMRWSLPVERVPLHSHRRGVFRMIANAGVSLSMTSSPLCESDSHCCPRRSADIRDPWRAAERADVCGRILEDRHQRRGVCRYGRAA